MSTKPAEASMNHLINNLPASEQILFLHTAKRLNFSSAKCFLMPVSSMPLLYLWVKGCTAQD